MHKDKDIVFCGIYDGQQQREVKEFSTTSTLFVPLGEHQQEQGAVKVAPESTGINWISDWNIIDAMAFALMLVNPYLIKQMSGRKSDVKYKQWIATLLHKQFLRGSLIPDQNIRELRSCCHRYNHHQNKQIASPQELERDLKKAGIRITSLASNISAKGVCHAIE